MSTQPETETVPLQLTVNGEQHSVDAAPWQSLADVLRRSLNLTGTTVGCGLGTCGSCTVLVDGDPVRSCVMLAVQADNSTVETVESLAPDGKLNVLQQAFREHGALQCGFCTPGFLMLGTELLRREPEADERQIRECLSANLCRCTGYGGMVEAVAAATSAGLRRYATASRRDTAAEPAAVPSDGPDGERA
ncbi:(2Fe-2S)-binding protein [Actinacidiphila sp. ITFR-21]|uniref:(2Fe-2S)-binding protein n=1 Tax=Actinacidiphila sp. ITFR-21 TaxID=3075199 RepID=UPI00288B2386|nr:2Fe-2S iron-sulfur cluster-binding protein [Streptomyces sp. ITFR-21]WNI17840.1 (2Fe-2S)-binding protein [Streptomyces sp. ITFR-21]